MTKQTGTKPVSVLLIILLVATTHAGAQSKWFSLYTDSTALLNDAGKVISQIAGRFRQANPAISFHPVTAIKNTTPGLIYVFNDTVSLPFWSEVIPEQKKFFIEVAGGEREGQDVFGLFFNGFYLAHELGHSFADNAGKTFTNSYDAEYDANVIGILYWRAAGEAANLKRCYQYARRMLKTLKDPIPPGEDPKKYMTQHYNELSIDPYKYGYIQFSQFIDIYNNKGLPGFNAFIRNYKK